MLIERDGPVTIVSIDRPARRNALDRAMWQALALAVRDLGIDLTRGETREQ